MILSVYTAGELQGTLPEGVLQESYPLHVDSYGSLHQYPQCNWRDGEVSATQVRPSEITIQTECHCLTMNPQSPQEFRVLGRLSYRYTAAQRAHDLTPMSDPQNIFECWRALYNICDTHEGIFPVVKNPALEEYIQESHQEMRALEEDLRCRLREHPSRPLPLGESTHLVAVASLGLPHVHKQRHLARVCLQVKGLDPWSSSLLGVIDGAHLGDLIAAAPPDRREVTWDERTHVQLDESDTPEIIEIAKALWDPHNPTLRSITQALEIARQV